MRKFTLTLLSCALLSYALCGGLLACGGQSSQGTPRNSADGNLPDEDGQSSSNAPVSTSKDVVLGERLLAAGKVEQARAAFQRAVDADRTDARAHFDLGLALEMSEHVADAERAYRSALQYAPQFVEAMNNLGLLLREQQKQQEAILLFERAVTLNRNFTDAYVNLALTAEDVNDYPKANRAYQAAIALEPRNAILRSNFGLLLLSQKNTSAAIKMLKQALQLAGNNRAALLAIGTGMRLAGQSADAITALKRAIQSGDGKATPALLAELALAERAAGDRQSAERELEQALVLDPKYATAHYLLANMLAGRGALKDAASHFKRYLELEPKGPMAQKARERLQRIVQSSSATRSAQ